jgi:hypothetical protein
MLEVDDESKLQITNYKKNGPRITRINTNWSSP